jgi:membrane protease YdiL (CAAX protease family)
MVRQAHFFELASSMLVFGGISGWVMVSQGDRVMGLTRWVKRAPLVAYFVQVFGIEWLVFLVLSPLVPPMIALLIGSWLPNAVGLFVTGVADGRAGLRELFQRVVLWRIGLKWYAIALFAPIAMAFLTLGLYALLGNGAPGFAPASQLLPILMIAVFTGALGEELGWRGTALPRLQARWNALTSSLILGVLWGLYHLPAFLLSGLPQQSLPLLSFMVAALALTVLISWTFNHTGGSLIPVFLYHCAFNFIGNAAGIFAVPALFWLLAGVASVAAVAVIALDWSRFTRPAAGSVSAIGGYSEDRSRA